MCCLLDLSPCGSLESGLPEIEGTQLPTGNHRILSAPAWGDPLGHPCALAAAIDTALEKDMARPLGVLDSTHHGACIRGHLVFPWPQDEGLHFVVQVKHVLTTQEEKVPQAAAEATKALWEINVNVLIGFHEIQPTFDL